MGRKGPTGHPWWDEIKLRVVYHTLLVLRMGNGSNVPYSVPKPSFVFIEKRPLIGQIHKNKHENQSLLKCLPRHIFVNK